MCILIYSYNYYPEKIGIAPLMTELAEGLVKRGHNVRVVTAFPWYPDNTISSRYSGRLYLKEEINGVIVQRCYVRANPNRTLLNRILFELSFVIFSFFQAFFGQRPEVILYVIPGLPVTLPATILGKIFNVPVLLNLQDILPDAAIEVGLMRNPWMIKVSNWLADFAYRNAEEIIVIHEGFRKNLVNRGVDPDKIFEIPNWVNINEIRPIPRDKPNSFQDQYNLHDRFVVLYSGNIARTQPLEYLIHAASFLNHLPDITIVIVGPTRSFERLNRAIALYEVRNAMILPFQSDERYKEMLAASHICMVMQCRNVVDFNMPSKIPKIMASGRAIIASVPENGTAASVIRRSNAGIVVPPENSRAIANAIQNLYSDRELLDQLGENGRRYAERHFSFNRIIRKYQERLGLAIEKYQERLQLAVEEYRMKRRQQ